MKISNHQLQFQQNIITDNRMFAPNRNLAKNTKKKAITKSNLSKKLFDDDPSYNTKQIHKISSVRNIQPIWKQPQLPNKTHNYNQYQTHNVAIKHRRKQSYMGSQGHQEASSSQMMADRYNRQIKMRDNASQLKFFYQRIENELSQILAIVKKQGKEANENVRAIRQKIRNNKIQQFKKRNKQYLDKSTQMNNEVQLQYTESTRTRHYTFHEDFDDFQRQETSTKINLQQQQYIQKKLMQLGLKLDYIDHIGIDGDDAVDDTSDSLSEEEMIQFNKYLIYLILCSL